MPDEEGPPYDTREEAFKALVVRLAELGVNVGILDSVMGHYPEHVREGFLEKINNTIDYLDRLTGEFQSFGEAFDDDADD